MWSPPENLKPYLIPPAVSAVRRAPCPRVTLFCVMFQTRPRTNPDGSDSSVASAIHLSAARRSDVTETRGVTTASRSSRLGLPAGRSLRRALVGMVSDSNGVSGGADRARVSASRCASTSLSPVLSRQQLQLTLVALSAARLLPTLVGRCSTPSAQGGAVRRVELRAVTDLRSSEHVVASFI